MALDRTALLSDVFSAMDINSDGRVDLGEFLQLRKIQGLAMNRAELKALFHAKDADGSGTLDLPEFRALCDATGLLEHKAAILSAGEARRAKHDDAARNAQELWRLGLPKEKPTLAPPAERPSLVGVSAAIANMRKAMGSVS